ncbi:hypothetical protein [Halobacillus sp. GSS1]|nr:hypothetical protein [Halobacillus sp. GSS1]
MHEAHGGLLFDLIQVIPFLLVIPLYIGAGFVSNRFPHLKK